MRDEIHPYHMYEDATKSMYERIVHGLLHHAVK